MTDRTNAQIALEAATRRYKGLHPTGKSTFSAEELAKGPLALAAIFKTWLDKNSDPVVNEAETT